MLIDIAPFPFLILQYLFHNVLLLLYYLFLLVFLLLFFLIFLLFLLPLFLSFFFFLHNLKHFFLIRKILYLSNNISLMLIFSRLTLFLKLFKDCVYILNSVLLYLWLHNQLLISFHNFFCSYHKLFEQILLYILF